jgi:hypothetical protein
VTVIDTTAGGGAFTTTGIVAVFVGSATDVAVMFALPTATPVSTPAAVTDAIEALELLHVTAVDAPPTTETVAVSGTFCPTMIVGVAGVIATDTTAGFGLTVTDADALFVASKLDVAVIVADPTATACTWPLVETLAVAAFDEVHETPVDAPFTTLTVAVNCC